MSFRVSPLAWVMLLSTSLMLPAQAVDVRAIRLWAGPDSTRVVLDLSGSAQHSLQVLKNPDRVVLDVAGARLARRRAQRSGRQRHGETGAHGSPTLGGTAHRARHGAAHPSEELSGGAQ